MRAERDRLRAELESAATNGSSRQTAAGELAERAVAKLSRLADELRSYDPLRMRAVLKEVVSDVTLFWTRKNKSQFRVEKGHICFCCVENQGTALQSQTRLG